MPLPANVVTRRKANSTRYYQRNRAMVCEKRRERYRREKWRILWLVLRCRAEGVGIALAICGVVFLGWLAT